MNEEGQFVKNLNDPPLKDTVTVLDAGFTMIRLIDWPFAYA